MALAKPEISVIITAYNRMWALPRAIESCRTGNSRTEIVVVDDGSTDGTWSWLQAQEDVVAIRTDNWGKCWAANAGFAASTGEYVRFLDSDDWLLDRANDRQLVIARASKADVIVAGHIHFEEETGRTEEIHCGSFDDFLSGYLESVSLGADCTYTAYLMNRSFIASLRHRQEFPWDDIMFMLEVALASPNIARCDFPAVVYRQHHRDRRASDNTGFDRVYEVWRTIAMYKKALTLVCQRNEYTHARKSIILKALWIEARKLAEWDIKEAVGLFGWILEKDRSFMPPVNQSVTRLYQTLGFGLAERVLRARRTFLRACGFTKATTVGSPLFLPEYSRAGFPVRQCATERDGG